MTCITAARADMIVAIVLVAAAVESQAVAVAVELEAAAIAQTIVASNSLGNSGIAIVSLQIIMLQPRV